MACCQTRKDEVSPRRKRTTGHLDDNTSDTSRKEDEFAKRFSLESASSTSTNSSVSICVIEELNDDEEKRYENNRDGHAKIKSKLSSKPNKKCAKQNTIIHESSPRRTRRSKSADDSLRDEHRRHKDSERSKLLSRVHSENDRRTGRKNFCCDGNYEHPRLEKDRGTFCPSSIKIAQVNESTNVKSPRRTAKKCSFAADKSKPAKKNAMASYSSPKKSIQTLCEAPIGSMNSTYFDVDKPGSPIKVCKRTDASTVQTEQAGLTEEQKAWAGIDRLLASDGASIETRDVLPSAVLRALNDDQHSCRQNLKIYRNGEVDPSDIQTLAAAQFACLTSSPKKDVNSHKRRSNKASQVHHSATIKEQKQGLHLPPGGATGENYSKNNSDANLKQHCRETINTGKQHFRFDHTGAGRSPRKQGPKTTFRYQSSIEDELSQLPNEYEVRQTDIFTNSMPSLMTAGSQELFGSQAVHDISPKWASCSDISYYEAVGNENAEILEVKTESLEENAKDHPANAQQGFDEYAFYYGEMEGRVNPHQSTFRDLRLASSQFTKMNGSFANTKKSQSVCKSQATRAKQKAPKRVQRLGSLAVPSKEKYQKQEFKKSIAEIQLKVELQDPMLASCSPQTLENNPKPTQTKDTPPLLKGITPRRIFKSDFGYVSRYIYRPKSHQRFRYKERTFRLLSTHLPVISLFGRKMISESPKIIDTGRCEAQFYPDHSDRDDDHGLGELLER